MYSTKEMQQKLKDLGYYAGTVDGIAGPKTSAAIVAFKKSVGLKATDFYGPITDEALKDAKVVEKTVSTASLPSWLKSAYALNGLREVKGSRHAPEILEMWKSIGQAGIRDDETSWCAAFVGWAFEKNGIVSSRAANARSYCKWGVELKTPVPGAVAVFWRGDRNGWQGHVGFVVAKDQLGRIIVLGGNQSDAVNEKPFDTGRLLGYYWPKGVPVPAGGLPVWHNGERSSENES